MNIYLGHRKLNDVFFIMQNDIVLINIFIYRMEKHMQTYLPWIALLITVIIFWGLHTLERKHINFGVRTLVALGLGIIIGLLFQGHTEYVSIFGRVFTRLISVIVLPLLFFGILSNIASLDNINRLKRLGLRSLFWLLVNTVLAASLTLIIAGFLKVGTGFVIDLPTDFVPREVPTFIDTLIGFVPNNIFAHATENQIVPFIVFTVLVGIALIKLNGKKPDQAKVIINFISAVNQWVFELVKIVIRLTPYAVVSYIASVFTRDGAKNLGVFTSVILIAYAISIIQTFIVHGTLVAVFAKYSPIKFFKGIWPAQIVAFTSQSSIGTIPVTVKQLTEKIGVKDEIASFVAGLGANTGMPGCTAIWPVLLAIFSINALGIDYSIGQYLLLILYSLVVSFGTAGVPGTATIAATAVLSAAGLPLEIIFVLAPISSLVDMARTATNVTGAATAAVIVASKENMLTEVIS